jgi:hypothetical protein
VWVFLNLPGDPSTAEETAARVAQASASGFTVLDLSSAYAGQDLKTIQMAPWDFHPNARGHRVIADALYNALRERSDILPVALVPNAGVHGTSGQAYAKE